jgi:hypothetical protein
MKDFFFNLKSPGWWLGVVVISFLINLAGLDAVRKISLRRSIDP